MFHRTLLSLWLILGLLLSACAAPAAAPTAPTPAPDSTASTPADGRTVAILVVDKFTDVSSEEVKPKENYPEGEGCVAFPPGKAGGADYISRGGGGREHGKLVWSTITEELGRSYGVEESAGNLSNDELWTELANNLSTNDILPGILARESVDEYNEYIENFSQLWHIPDEGNIRLIPVDIGDFDTATVADGITNTLNLLAKSSEQIDQVVINMSWVILPKKLCKPLSEREYINAVCRVMNETDMANVRTLELLSNLLDAYGQTNHDPNSLCAMDLNVGNFSNVSPAVLQILLDPFFLGHWFNDVYNRIPEVQDTYVETYTVPSTSEPRPLFNALSWLAVCKPTSDGNFCPQQTISIAAAGNEAWEFPFMPGLWKSVVSVGATDSSDAFASYSNGSEVILNGEHPHQAGLLTNDPEVCGSLFDCSLYEGHNSVVGTSYAAPRLSLLAARYLLDRDEPSCPTPPLGYNQWDNLTIEDAADQYCQDFPSSP